MQGQQPRRDRAHQAGMAGEGAACEVLRPPAHACEVLRPPAHACEVLRPPAHACVVLRPPAHACEVLRPPAHACEVLRLPAHACAGKPTYATAGCGVAAGGLLQHSGAGAAGAVATGGHEDSGGANGKPAGRICTALGLQDSGCTLGSQHAAQRECMTQLPRSSDSCTALSAAPAATLAVSQAATAAAGRAAPVATLTVSPSQQSPVEPPCLSTASVSAQLSLAPRAWPQPGVSSDLNCSGVLLERQLSDSSDSSHSCGMHVMHVQEQLPGVTSSHQVRRRQRRRHLPPACISATRAPLREKPCRLSVVLGDCRVMACMMSMHAAAWAAQTVAAGAELVSRQAACRLSSVLRCRQSWVVTAASVNAANSGCSNPMVAVVRPRAHMHAASPPATLTHACCRCHLRPPAAPPSLGSFRTPVQCSLMVAIVAIAAVERCRAHCRQAQEQRSALQCSLTRRRVAEGAEACYRRHCRSYRAMQAPTIPQGVRRQQPPLEGRHPTHPLPGAPSNSPPCRPMSESWGLEHLGLCLCSL
jgi:hypothetical protein